MRFVLVWLMAAKLAGVTMPDAMTVAGKQLVLNGIGLREATVFKVDVYVAGLYLEHRSFNPAEVVAADETKLLVLRFVRDVDRGDIVKAWNEGFKNNAVVPLAQIAGRMDQLDGMMPKLRAGDTLAFAFIPNKGVEVSLNGVPRGTIPGDDFARSLLSIWLGPHPPTGDLKRELMPTR